MGAASLEARNLLTDELKAWIGHTTGPLPLPEEVSSSDVRRQGRTGLGGYVTSDSEYRGRASSQPVARVRQTVVRLPRADRSDPRTASAGA